MFQLPVAIFREPFILQKHQINMLININIILKLILKLISRRDARKTIL